MSRRRHFRMKRGRGHQVRNSIDLSLRKRGAVNPDQFDI
jgi:hypothetical protein